MKKGLLGWVFMYLMAINIQVVQARCMPTLPTFQPFTAPDFSVGYFEVHNTLNGLPNNNIRCILALDGALLVGTEGGGLMIYREGRWSSYTPDSNPPFPAPTVSCLVKDPEDKGVIAGTPKGLVKIFLPGGTPEFALLPLSGGGSRNILSLAVLDKNLLVGTDREAGEFSGEAILPLTMQDTAPSPIGFAAAIPYEGTCWFGTGHGAFTARNHLLVPFRVPGFEFGWVKGFAAAGKELYLASSNGLFQVTGDKAVQVSSETWFTCLAATPGTSGYFQNSGPSPLEVEGLDDPAISRMTPENKKKIEALNLEIKKVNKKITEWNALYSRSPYLTNDPQRARLMAEGDRVLAKMQTLGMEVQVRAPLMKGLWAGTQDKGAILFAADGKRRELTTENSKLPGNRVTAICSKESGETWIGTYDSGLLHYTRTSAGSFKDPLLVWEGAVNLVRVGGENLFIGTKENGLLVFNPKSLAKTGEYTPVTVPGFHRSVTGVGVDQQARLWVAGDKGLWMKDETGWHPFTRASGLPDDKISCLEIDRNGKVFAAGGDGREISKLLAVFNGTSFTPFSIETVKAFLGMNASDSLSALRGLGLLDTYMEKFDVKNATQALALYDDQIPESEVAAMLGASEYLLLGTKAGSLFVFYGPMFKRVSNEGTGTMKKVIGMAKRKNGEIILVSDKRVFLMDGQHFRPVSGISGKNIRSLTDLGIDDKNQDLFWVSYTSTDGGGLALFEDGNWTVKPMQDGIISFALTDPFLYFATEKGVYQVLAK